jgi:hypothetical protein
MSSGSLCYGNEVVCRAADGLQLTQWHGLHALSIKCGNAVIIDKGPKFSYAAPIRKGVNSLAEPAVDAMSGPQTRMPGSYAASCLLARRLIEAGVRFVQIFDRDWDHHRSAVKHLRAKAAITDQPTAVLIRDLKLRGRASSFPAPAASAPRRPPVWRPTPRVASSSHPEPQPARPPSCSPLRTVGWKIKRSAPRDQGGAGATGQSSPSRLSRRRPTGDIASQPASRDGRAEGGSARAAVQLTLGRGSGQCAGVASVAFLPVGRVA